MNTARYVVAVVSLVSTPPAVLLWVAIHPFAASWRKIGPGWTYAVLTPPTVGFMWALWHFRRPLLGADLGTSIPMLVVAAAALVVAVRIGWARRRHLTRRILVGVPELSPAAYPGTLLTEGPYALVRHPRYVEVTFGVGAYAAFANFLGLYLIFAASVAALYAVTLMEERELVARFGDAYVAYAKRVPRFIPRRAGNEGRCEV